MATSTIKQSAAVLKNIERIAVLCDWSSESHGFVDSGISTQDYVLLCAYALTSANINIRVSNLTRGNYRFQCINAVTNEIEKTGNTYVFAFVLPVQYITT